MTDHIISRKDMLDTMGVRSGQRIFFNMPVEFDHLIGNRMGVEYMNNMVDEFVEDGHMLEDICFNPIKLEGDTIIVQVDALATRWLQK
jgi:hypothetical protein